MENMTGGKYYIHREIISTEKLEAQQSRNNKFEITIDEKINEGYIPLGMYKSKLINDSDGFEVAMYLPPKPVVDVSTNSRPISNNTSTNSRPISNNTSTNSRPISITNSIVGGSYKIKSKKTKKLNKYM